MQHRDRRRRRGVPVGRPGVERPDPGEDAEPDVEGEEDPALEPQREHGGLELEEGKRRGAGAHVEREDPDQDERRAEEQVERQLHRRVLFRPDARLPVGPREDPPGPHVARRAPDPDQQVHREDGQLVEEEQDEEVQRREDAVHARHERQQQRVELLAPDRHGPRREDARGDDDRRQQHHQQADPVDAELVGDAQRRDQRDLLVELEPGRLVVVGGVGVDRQQRRDAGRHHGDPPHRAGAMARREHDEQRADERQPRDGRQDRQGEGAYRHSCAHTSSTPNATP